MRFCNPTSEQPRQTVGRRPRCSTQAFAPKGQQYDSPGQAIRELHESRAPGLVLLALTLPWAIVFHAFSVGYAST